MENLKALLQSVPMDQRNLGLLWSTYYGLVDAKLAARRNTREFAAWKTVNSDNAVKDSLSGKEEVIGNEEFWRHLRKHFSFFAKASGHSYGAMNLVKRVWCRPEALDGYPNTLWRRLGLTGEKFSAAIGMESTKDVAEKNQNGSGYIAVIGMDGDQMGKWISGEKTPPFRDQLAAAPPHGLEELHRPLTPAYHLQFSEALANFSIWTAAKVVENYGGQLIYAGGDDVLAMLPADRAIDCAWELKKAFTTDFDGSRLMPGSKGNVSAGLAIGSHSAPLQMLVKEAQNAEHHAKHDYGREALAISLYKRSGEILQWGCKWDSPALPLMDFLEKHRAPIDDGMPKQDAALGKISGRFPYALARALAPYRLGAAPTLSAEELQEIMDKETAIVIRRQASDLTQEDQKELAMHCKAWCEKCLASKRLADYIMPFLTEAFINRKRGED